MRMKKIGLYIFTAIGITLILSYRQAQEKDIITKHKWIISSATTLKPVDLNNRGTLSTDLLAQSPYCIKDNIFIFKVKGIFAIDDNDFPCAEPSSKNGKWNFIGKDSLQIDFGIQDLKIKYKITKLNAEEMVLTTSMPFIPGGVEVVYSFKKVIKK